MMITKKFITKFFWIILIMKFDLINYANCIDYIVDVPNIGKIQGSTVQTAWTKQFIMQFLGIPYAESPSKERRFLPPKSKAKWDDIRDGKNYGRPCPSKLTLANLNSTQMAEDIEDCLNLCIFTKNITAKASNPVMFLIHGGSFIDENAKLYQPDYLLEKNIVLVVVQYRIGVLGFVSTSSEEIPGNIGIMDILLALKWTKQNIEYFGGDPKNITIFGQDSGGIITSLLLISPGVPNDLFQRGIFQSGSILEPKSVDKEPIENAMLICRQVNCTTCTTIIEINTCLKNATTEQLVNVNADIRLTLKDFNGIIPKMPKLLMKTIKNKYPMMAGTTKHDGTFILKKIYDSYKKSGGNINDINPKQFMDALIIKGCGSNDDSGITLELSARALFDTKDLVEKIFEKLWPAMIDVSSVCNYKAPLLYYADIYAQNTTKPVYLYTFDYMGENTRLNLKKEDYPFDGGVAHGNDMIYLFPWQTESFNAADLDVAKNMINIWTSFATNSKPLPLSNDTVLIEISNSSSVTPYFSISDKITIGTNYLIEFTAAQKDENGSEQNQPKLIIIVTSIMLLFQLKCLL